MVTGQNGTTAKKDKMILHAETTKWYNAEKRRLESQGQRPP